ncbi:hypothetical protein FB451DRAFT_423313 [Mycena latifolia]|nr:hypothetical protein FB451DRAFT_423313 [Mycena latifolia]
MTSSLYKNSAFYVTEQILDPGILTTASGIVEDDSFTGDCPTAQVATLRSLAMITPFMNTLVAETAFKQTNDCIRGIYQTWYTAYAANAPPNTVPSPAIFVGAYNAWVKQIVSGIQDAITSQMDTLIPLYNNGDTRAVAIKLGTNSVLSEWANLYPAVPAGTPWVPTKNLNTATNNANLISVQSVSTADLRTLRNRVPPINWASTLP